MHGIRTLSKLCIAASVLAAACFSWPAAAADAARVLRLTTVQETDQLVKPAKQVLDVAYRSLNIQIDIIPLPLERSLMLASSGAYDGDLGRTQSVELDFPRLLRVPTPIGTVEVVPYVLRPVGSDASSWSALKASKLKVGAKFGDRMTDAHLGDFVSSKATSFESLFQMLVLQRVDVVIAPRGELQRLLPLLPTDRQEELKGVMALPALSSVPIYHFLHEKNRDLLIPLDRELQKMTKAGTIDFLWRQGGK